MITTGQVLGIIVATLGVVAALIAMTTPDFGRIFTGSYRRVATALIGLTLLIVGIWAVPYYAERPKTFVDSGRQVIHKSRDALSEKLDTMKTWQWWPWKKTDPPLEKK